MLFGVDSAVMAALQAPEELSVAPQGASAELKGLPGVWAAVKCLVSVGSTNVGLIKAHARYNPCSKSGMHCNSSPQPIS